MSTLGVAPFFVENVSELQLNAMKLVTTVSISCKVFHIPVLEFVCLANFYADFNISLVNWLVVHLMDFP
jgi:hypothetical protein